MMIGTARTLLRLIGSTRVSVPCVQCQSLSSRRLSVPLSLSKSFTTKPPPSPPLDAASQHALFEAQMKELQNEREEQFGFTNEEMKAWGTSSTTTTSTTTSGTDDDLHQMAGGMSNVTTQQMPQMPQQDPPIGMTSEQIRQVNAALSPPPRPRPSPQPASPPP